MHFTFRTPKLIPLLAITIAAAFLFCLGLWQVQRLEWKEDLLKQLDVASHSEPLTKLPKTNEELLALQFHRVKLSGSFDHAHEVHAAARYYQKKLGYHIYTPFTLDKDGRAVLVNRGWVPVDQKEQEKRPDTIKEKHAVIDGMIIMPNLTKRFFNPRNHPEKNIWFQVVPEEVKKAADLELLPITIDRLGDGKSDQLPIPVTGQISLRNDHLGYAITWFSLSAVMLIMFGICHIDWKRKDHA